MQCRDKGRWRTMTKFEIRIRNDVAYASQMQFELLRRALWAQQARPQTTFTYLNHGVKAKMCETTPFVNAVGAHYVASRAHVEQCWACQR